MKKIILTITISLFLLGLKAQILLIDKTDSNYVINQKEYLNDGRNCFAINIIAKKAINEWKNIRPFIFIRAFDFTNATLLECKPAVTTSIDQFVSATVLPSFGVYPFPGRNDKPAYIESNSLWNYSLIFFDGKNYWSQAGIILIQFFNINNGVAINPLKPDEFTLNTEGPPVEIDFWLKKDSLPFPKDKVPFEKIYLLKRDGDEYTFFKHGPLCTDCSEIKYSEYVYKKGYGITAFRSQYYYNNPDPGTKKYQPTFSTYAYYYFK